MSEDIALRVKAVELATEFTNLRAEGIARAACARYFLSALTRGVRPGCLEGAIKTETTVEGAIDLAEMYAEFLDGHSATSS